MTFCCLLSGTALQFLLDIRAAWFFHMENLQSIPAEVSLSLLKIISRWRKF